MSRWQPIIDLLLADLEKETPGVEGFRINIDHKMAEHETIASLAQAIAPTETPEQRKQDFQASLRLALVARRDVDPSNKIWSEALHLLNNPKVRVPDHKRPPH